MNIPTLLWNIGFAYFVSGLIATTVWWSTSKATSALMSLALAMMAQVPADKERWLRANLAAMFPWFFLVDSFLWPRWIFRMEQEEQKLLRQIIKARKELDL